MQMIGVDQNIEGNVEKEAPSSARWAPSPIPSGTGEGDKILAFARLFLQMGEGGRRPDEGALVAKCN